MEWRLGMMVNCHEQCHEICKNKKPCVSQLYKIHFTQNVFEVVHAHQMEEMHSAIAGVSDKYVLADHTRYLLVPADVWFEWTPEMRKDYVLGIQKLPINNVFKQKDVPWPSFESSRADEKTEFRLLDTDIVEELVNSHGYSEKNAEALKKEVLYLSKPPCSHSAKGKFTNRGCCPI